MMQNTLSQESDRASDSGSSTSSDDSSADYESCTEKGYLNIATDVAINLHSLLRNPDLKSLCDVVFIVGGRRFLAHKSVLACSSPVFAKMFTNGMNETISAQYPLEIPLEGIDPRAWQIVLKFMYTGRVYVKDEETAILVLQSAHKYNLERLCAFIGSFLMLRCSVRSCVRLYNVAEVYSMEELRKACISHMKIQFERFSFSKELLQGCGKELMLHLLRSDDLSVKSELTVFQAIINWVEADKNGRSCHLEDMLQMVRLSKMTMAELLEVAVNTAAFSCKTFRAALRKHCLDESSGIRKETLLETRSCFISRQRTSEYLQLKYWLRWLHEKRWKIEYTHWKMIPSTDCFCRLRIYPNGCKSVSGEFLSVFLEVRPAHKISFEVNLRFKFFLVNRRNLQQSISMETSQIFSSENLYEWGFNEFVALSILRDARQGFLDHTDSALLGVDVVLLGYKAMSCPQAQQKTIPQHEN